MIAFSNEDVTCLENTDFENTDLENTDLKKTDLENTDLPLRKKPPSIDAQHVYPALYYIPSEGVFS